MRMPTVPSFMQGRSPEAQDFSSPPVTQPSAEPVAAVSFPRLRKSPTYRVPWLTVTPGGEIKPKDLEDGKRIGEPFGVCLFVLISPYFYPFFPDFFLLVLIFWWVFPQTVRFVGSSMCLVAVGLPWSHVFFHLRPFWGFSSKQTFQNSIPVNTCHTFCWDFPGTDWVILDWFAGCSYHHCLGCLAIWYTFEVGRHRRGSQFPQLQRLKPSVSRWWCFHIPQSTVIL